MEQKIEFVGQILDNVHGFIEYTETEKQIIESLLFKRLQSIKQLSIANWVFPGSEHTRYIHSLGVMHIADKMAIQIGLSVSERKIIRLAGLLHDIGHYPLSHVCEFPYKKPSALFELPDDEFCSEVNKQTQRQIDSFSIDAKISFMSKSSGRHHEFIGASIVLNNDFIRDLIIKECENENAPKIIADIITGNIERAETDPLLVQIIHSELDADGIDYLMRDATFSGTSFGSFELDQLISSLCYYTTEDGKRILCINPKGIAAADQYLINKFFSYSQVVFNRHIVVSEWMAECVINWMQQHHAIFPSGSMLESWVKSKEDCQEYIDFNDNMFWAALSRILSNELSDLVPHYIKVFCRHLLHHEEPECVKSEEVKIISTDASEIKDALKEVDCSSRTDVFDILSVRTISKQVPIDIFEQELQKKKNDEPDIEEAFTQLRLSRLMECISIKDGNDIHLLCDDKRSLLRSVYNNTLVFLRVYKFPQEDA